MNVGQAAAFWGVAALLIVTPGADWAYAITSGLRNRSPLPGVLGMISGHLLAAVVVSAGLGALVAGAPIVLTVLTYAGAIYLCWLGIAVLRSSPGTPQAEAEALTTTSLAQVTKGFGVTALNPKLPLLFLALLPQFTDPSASWDLGAQMLALGLLHVGTTLAVYLVVGYGARRVLRTRPAAARIVTRLSGVIMIGIGLFLFIQKLLT